MFEMPSNQNEKGNNQESLCDRVREFIHNWNAAEPGTHDRRAAGRALVGIVPRLESAGNVEALVAILRESSSTMNLSVRTAASDALLNMIETGKVSDEQLVKIVLDRGIKSVLVHDAVREVLVRCIESGAIVDANILSRLVSSNSSMLRVAIRNVSQK